MAMKKSAKKTFSFRSAAKELGVSDSAVREWAKHDSWPTDIPRKPPWDAVCLSRIADWRIQTLKASDSSGPADPELAGLRRQKLEFEIERLKIAAQRARLEYDKERGLLISAEDVERGNIARIQAVKRAMENAAHKLSIDLADKLQGQATIHSIIEAEMQRICNAFAQGQQP